jgi:iron-sulfur cluster repair protein YtfE (RIC family)
MNPKLRIPAPLKSAHDELHATIVKAAREEGDIGVAAKTVGALLQAHFVKEEQFALLPLGLLETLAQGEVHPDMDEALVLVDRLRHEHGAMVNEHQEIVAALRHLLAAARAADRVEYAEFAEHLIRHLHTEEHVLYPAVLLAGRYIRLRMGLADA